MFIRPQREGKKALTQSNIYDKRGTRKAGLATYQNQGARPSKSLEQARVELQLLALFSYLFLLQSAVFFLGGKQGKNPLYFLFLCYCLCASYSSYKSCFRVIGAVALSGCFEATFPMLCSPRSSFVMRFHTTTTICIAVWQQQGVQRKTYASLASSLEKIDEIFQYRSFLCCLEATQSSLTPLLQAGRHSKLQRLGQHSFRKTKHHVPFILVYCMTIIFSCG